MAKAINLKIIKEKPLVAYIAIILFIDFFYFGASYFFYTGLSWPFFIIPFIIVSLGFWLFMPINPFKKALIIFITSILSIFSGFLVVFLTMYIPGSKEHNYVMYSVCFPAMKKYYDVKDGGGFPAGEVDKNGQSKWWHQHSECEDNVRNGKGPVFSDNPPGFIPVKNYENKP